MDRGGWKAVRIKESPTAAKSLVISHGMLHSRRHSQSGKWERWNKGGIWREIKDMPGVMGMGKNINKKKERKMRDYKKKWWQQSWM